MLKIICTDIYMFKLKLTVVFLFFYTDCAACMPRPLLDWPVQYL